MHDTHRSATARLDPARRAGDLLPLADFAVLLGTGYLSARLYALQAGSGWQMPDGLLWSAAVLAAFVLYDACFTERAGSGPWRAFGARALAFLAATLATAFAASWLEHAPAPWFAAWLAFALAACAALRLLMRRRLRPRAMPAADDAHAPHPGRIAAALPVTVLVERPIRRWHRVVKAGMDYTLGGLATLALLPALGAIALAIRLDGPGPVLFKQRRHGYNNREFEIYKFRTMRIGANPSADKMKQTERGDPRITRIGRFLRKWSLDELPQLFNVLRGEMSLVGPRPHAVVMRTADRLGEEIVATYPHRHRVKPGITGWAQVHGARGATDTEAQLRRRIELDLYYIEHCSPLLDLKVLVMTCREVLRATNAF
jgi:lipopolysaccharide/colanic/teichoic acid biosynthesis glycosyltransferase